MSSRPARWIAATLTALALAGAVSGCGAPSSSPALSAEAPGQPETAIMLVERGRHTDLALPADALTGPAAETFSRDFPGATFLVFGFGDRAYLMDHGVEPIHTLKAIFPGPGVILVTGLTAPPAEAFPDDRVMVLKLSCARRAALAAYVERALAMGAEGAPRRLRDGPYPGSAFYDTTSVYDLLHDCNRWTAAALEHAGFAVVPEGVIISSQVTTQVASIVAHQTPAAPADCLSGPSAPRAG